MNAYRVVVETATADVEVIALGETFSQAMKKVEARYAMDLIKEFKLVSTPREIL